MTARLMPPTRVDVTVTEGTSMSVAASPDGRQLAIDLQGGLWLLPSAGGVARRITDEYNDARQPAWSPDGTQMAVIYEGVLALVPVGPSGAPLGTPRRITNEMAHAPSWTADSKRILYQSNNKLRLIDIETGDTRDVRLALDYTPAIPTASGGACRTPGRRPEHDAALHRTGTVVDATGRTVMPGLPVR